MNDLLFAVNLFGEFVDLFVSKGIEIGHRWDQLIGGADVRYVNHRTECRQHLHLPQHFLATSRPNNKQSATLNEHIIRTISSLRP